LCQNNASKLLNAYNKVFAAIIDDLLQNGNRQHEARINDWIEGDMRKAGLQPDATTLALKLKISLESLVGSRRERTVRRYLDMAKEYNLESEVFGLGDILNERNLGKLFQLCPLEVREIQHDHAISSSLGRDVDGTTAEKDDVQVLETEQKGMGLISLRKSLRLFNNSPQKAADEAFDEDLMARQHKLERDAIESARERWRIEYKKRAKMGVTGDLTSGKLGALLWIWHEALAERIIEELKLVKEAEHVTGRRTAQQKQRLEYGSFLESLSPEKMAATTTIAMMQILSKSGVSRPMKLVRLVTELGGAIETEFVAEHLNRKRSTLLKDFQKMKEAGEEQKAEWREDLHVHLHRRTFSHSASPYKYKANWSQAQHAKLGAILCELLFDTAKMTIKRQDKTTGLEVSIAQPIFLRSTAYQNGRRVGMVTLHEDFTKLLVSQPAEHLIAKQLPMICPPRPWKGFYDGGFLESSQPFLRVKNSEAAQREYGEAAAERGDLDQLFAGVDVLSRTGWRINQNVFNVMLEAWNSGKEIANLPPLDKVFPEIERPGENATHKERFQWFTKMREVDNERSGIHSNRCFQNFQMEIAKSYLNETFYLPHNVDFRGRAYPIPPYLNQMGADNCRGLLLFDKGRELGNGGLRWLKIHLSNVYGYDKASLADRAQFPMDHIEDVYDSVRNPLTGKRWWLTAEDPWQCLATCFELTAALESSDPSKFISRLPIHQDGSCNGLQHYAALGGDIAGARQVNLEPGDKPSDVYTGVCELVKASVAEDAAKGDALAKMLDGKITRKVVKQTVMTNVYGVTFLGAIRQVRKQVENLIPEIEAAQLSGKASSYIAKKIFQGLGKLFTGAHEIQYWLGDCANRISSSISPAQLDQMYDQVYGPSSQNTLTLTMRKKPTKKGAKESFESGVFRSSVIWTTPLKLPVVQPYRINKGRQIQTNLQNITLAQPSVADAVNRRKQLQAFPPNFIHSLDATHMVLSALKADELGLSFSAVHDSFWTHAADIDTLNTLLRDAFIRMHSEDIVGRLAAEFLMRYKGHYYLAQINKSNKLAQAIISYRKRLADEGLLPRGNGSKGIQERRHAELLREVRKQKLMASEDPKDREEGEKMETAQSLFEKFDGEKYLFNRDSLGETAIGSVPDDVDGSAVEEAINSSEVANDVDLASTLDPLRESVAESDEAEIEQSTTRSIRKGTSDAADPSHDVHQRNAFGEKIRKQTPAKSLNNQIWLWLPLKFRPVPKKGDFDVTRLRDSTYFFS
jgi:DNA-directed RNA polymerase